jgi:hypothetical protein
MPSPLAPIGEKESSMNIKKSVAVLACLGSVVMVACSGAVDSAEDDVSAEPSAETASVKQALAHCKLGLAYSGGSWRRAPIEGSCTSFPVETYSFGIASDIPLTMRLGVAQSCGFSPSLVTYGTATAGDRRGRFMIDRNCDRTWGGPDTNTKFMASPQASDQPFVINYLPKHKSGGVCVDDTGLSPWRDIIGIKRGSDWYIDADNDGVFNDTTGCDIYVTGYGAASDIPTPLDGRIATSRVVGAGREWYIDSNNDRIWNGAPWDTLLTGFGTGAWRPFTDTGGYHLGVQDGRDVYLNTDINYNWNTSGGEDIAAVDYLPSSSWLFVSWYEWQQIG